MNHLPRIKPRVGVNLISRIDDWTQAQRAALGRAGVGGAHRRDHIVDHFQAGDSNQQGDVRIDAHAHPKAKAGRATPDLWHKTPEAVKIALSAGKTNLMSLMPPDGEEFRLCRMLSSGNVACVATIRPGFPEVAEG